MMLISGVLAISFVEEGGQLSPVRRAANGHKRPVPALVFDYDGPFLFVCSSVRSFLTKFRSRLSAYAPPLFATRRYHPKGTGTMSGRRPSPWDYQQSDIPHYRNNDEASGDDGGQQQDYHAYSPQMDATPLWQQPSHPGTVPPQPAPAHREESWGHSWATQQDLTYNDPQRQQGFDPVSDRYGQGYQVSNQAGRGDQRYSLASQHQWNYHDLQRQRCSEPSTYHYGRASGTSDQAGSVPEPCYDSPDDVDYDETEASRYAVIQDDSISISAQAGRSAISQPCQEE